MMKMKFYCGETIQLPCHSPLRKILLVALSTENGLKNNYKMRSDLLLIAFTGNKKVGMVRFDLVESSMNNYYEISINLDPSFRGKIFSSHIMDLGIKYLNDSQKSFFQFSLK